MKYIPWKIYCESFCIFPLHISDILMNWEVLYQIQLRIVLLVDQPVVIARIRHALILQFVLQRLVQLVAFAMIMYISLSVYPKCLSLRLVKLFKVSSILLDHISVVLLNHIVTQLLVQPVLVIWWIHIVLTTEGESN